MTLTRLDIQSDGCLLLTVEAVAPAGSEAALIAAFVTPEAVARWWSAELTVGMVGEPYVAAFARLGQTMRGELLAHEPARRVGFTWAWEHEPMVPEYRVAVEAVAEGGRTRLTLTHGLYADDEAGRADAGSHRAGWEFFLPRLVAGV
ncbi:SRPBCC domain-containing protein [Phytomonospora sp. NPDC050363]|uniref:SRPBCC family protein n=1 Tax=Phytomonospora sp. NPDC050363 TaxID=3155642 RepID=UPI0033F89D4F